MSDSAGKSTNTRNISRRGFVKGTAALVGARVVAATRPLAADTQPNPPAASHVQGYCGEGDWLGVPPIIPDTQITKTFEVDVLVLGGGHAGVLAALGASDAGVKVAVIEKRDEAGFAKDEMHWIGQDVATVNSKWLLKRGYGPYDTGEIVAEFVKRGGGRCNPEIVRLFVENSGAMFDRMVEVYQGYEAQRKADDSAVKFVFSDRSSEIFDFSNILDPRYFSHHIQKDRSPKEYPIMRGGYKTWPCTIEFLGPLMRKPGVAGGSVLRWFEKYMVQKSKDNGAEWYYDHQAIVLTQDGGKAVTGAIMQDKSNNYIRFIAHKGVVVATGDFSGNKEMFWALMNDVIERAQREKGTLTLQNFVPPGTKFRDGAGHRMCCWAGGVIEPTPRALMATGSIATKNFPWGMTPMLLLNSRAKRFANEAAAFPLGHIAFRQPAGNICLVTDKNYLKSVLLAGVEHGSPNFGRPELLEDMLEDMGKVLAAGAQGHPVRSVTLGAFDTHRVYGAESLEQLADYLGYSEELKKTFLASIRRYNTLCHQKTDSDFGKDPETMIPIETAPFYGCKNNHAGQKLGMPTMCGLITDEKLCVLDKASNPIKGLYVAGNTLGGRYGMGYSTPIAGNTIGMAMTHGWLAGRFAAES